jgi:hypothetical protein
MADGPASSGTASGKMKGSRPPVGGVDAVAADEDHLHRDHQQDHAAGHLQRAFAQAHQVQETLTAHHEGHQHRKGDRHLPQRHPVRRCGATPPSTEMKIGRLPNGSSTSSSRTKAERKLWSIGQAARRVAMAAVL